MKTKICDKCHFVFENGAKECMCIPNNKTCSDCRHFNRCKALFSTSEDRKDCDFYPIRFVEKGDSK
jgi:hypothetical protein